MPELKSEYLFEMTINVAGSHLIGETPYGRRRMDYLSGGRVKGPKLTGVILPGGADVLTGTADGAMRPDVRLTIRSDDGALIYVNYRGIRHGPPGVMAAIAREESVPPDAYYLRTALFFETGAPGYDWLNRVVAVGVGRRQPSAAIYDVFQIL